MKTKYFLINESERDKYPIKVKFKDGKVFFKVENEELLVKNKSSMVCPKCKDKYEDNRRIKCGKCRVKLKAKNKREVGYSEEIQKSMKILEKIFISRKITGFNENGFLKAMNFVERDKVDKLYVYGINSLILNNVSINKQITEIRKVLKQMSIDFMQVNVRNDTATNDYEYEYKCKKSFYDDNSTTTGTTWR